MQRTAWLAGIPTLGDFLHEAGYTTALCGKWHCGAGEAPKSGFEYWYSAWRKTPKYNSSDQQDTAIRESVVERSGYDTQTISDAAIDFLRKRDAEKPFFLVRRLRDDA